MPKRTPSGNGPSPTTLRKSMARHCAGVTILAYNITRRPSKAKKPSPPKAVQDLNRAAKAASIWLNDPTPDLRPIKDLYAKLPDAQPFVGEDAVRKKYIEALKANVRGLIEATALPDAFEEKLATRNITENSNDDADADEPPSDDNDDDVDVERPEFLMF